jgi:hypothetical protein
LQRDEDEEQPDQIADIVHGGLGRYEREPCSVAALLTLVK